MKFAILGAGVIGDTHAKAIAQLSNTSLVALCSTRREKAAAMLAANNANDAQPFDDIHKMLREAKPDVLCICTPSGVHLENALAAIDAGVHIICEKPLEITLDRIDEMLAVAKSKGVRVAGIFQNRWNPANRALKEAAVAKRFGNIAWAGCFNPWWRSDDYYRDGKWRGTWKLDGGGAIMNQAIHSVDLLQWIAGPVKQLSAYAGRRAHDEIEVEDTLSCSLQFENGAFGTILGTTAMYPGGAVRIEIGGDSGMAVSENGLKTFAFRDAQPGDASLVESINAKIPVVGTGPKPASVEMHAANIASILSAWESDAEPETNGVEARKAVAIVLAMYESAKRGGEPVRVNR